jgi:hypothetical protein
VAWRSSTQKHVTLSVTEAEMGAGVTCVQDMMYVYNLMSSMGLQVQLPIVLEMDNQGAVDLANGWSVGGRTRHVDVRIHYIRELERQVSWLSSGYLVLRMTHICIPRMYQMLCLRILELCTLGKMNIL